MQSLERVHAQESCRCVAGVAVVCRSCGVPVSRLHSECTHALCCDERSGRPHGGGWQADERLYISCLHSKVLCRCVLCCRVVCGCGCLAPWRSVTDHRADSSLTHAHPPTQTHTHAHALMSCHCHHQCWLHSCRRLEGVVAPLSGSPGTAIMPHTPNSSFSLTTSCCSRYSPLLYSPSLAAYSLISRARAIVPRAITHLSNHTRCCCSGSALLLPSRSSRGGIGWWYHTPLYIPSTYCCVPA